MDEGIFFVFCVVVSLVALLGNVWYMTRFVDAGKTIIDEVVRLREELEAHEKSHK